MYLSIQQVITNNNVEMLKVFFQHFYITFKQDLKGFE
jgi:hypothetical protein